MERHSWVGCIRVDQKRTLDGPTNRDNPVLNQTVKPRNRSGDPLCFQVGLDLAAERPQPVALSRPRRSGGPPAGFQPTGYAGSNALHGSLKSIKVSTGASPHHASALGTTPTSDQYLLNKAIEKSPDKSMTPDPNTVTSRTRFRSGPRKVTAPLNNLLDGNTKGQYHRNTCSRASRPVHTRAVARTSHRPLHPVNLFR